MPRGVASLAGGSGVLLLGLAAFATILVSMGLAYGVWDLLRRIRRRAARRLKNERILQPPPRQTQTESDTLELGNMFRKDGHENEPFVLMPHNLASYLPSTPPRAHVSDTSPLTPPGLPPCKSSDSTRTPVLVLTNTLRTHKSVELLFGHNETIHNTEPQYQTAAHESDFVRIAFEGPVPGLGLGLMLDENECGKFTEEITCPETEETRLVEVGPTDSPKISAVTSQDPAATPASQTQSPPSSPFMTPSLPTLVITSASMHRRWSLEGRKTGKGSLRSPPKTPTLVLTSPSIHCGLDADPDREEGLACWNDSQNWGDVLEAEECDDEARALLGSLLLYPKQLETPPQTPIFLQMPESRSRVTPSPVEEGCQSISENYKDTLATSKQVDAENPFDYAAFHARLAAFNHNHKRVIIEEEIAGEGPLASSSSVFSSPSESSRLDYERLRARKRGAIVSAKSHPSNSPLSIKSPRPARCAARPRPLPLCRPGYI